MQTDLITKVYFNEHLTHSCVGMPQGLQALLSSLPFFNHIHHNVMHITIFYLYLTIFIFVPTIFTPI